MAVELELPWPPSVNHYWKNADCRVYVTQRGRDYRKTVYFLTRKVEPFGDKRLRVNIEAYPPDFRRRDLDNLLKAILDALEEAEVYHDDGNIDELSVSRKENAPPEGYVRVEIEAIGE